MDYNFLTLNPSVFESLIQSLSQKLLGDNSIVFGNGPDGGRELTFRGKANFPNNTETWDGYWVVQAKYKSRKFDKDDDFGWIKNNFVKEMNKFSDPKRKLEKPNNYLFFTNTILTAVQKKGGRDKIEKLKEDYTTLIPNIYIASYDELCKLLDNNRDVATAYSSFILSGDILSKLYNLLKYTEKKKNDAQNAILTYLEKSFYSDMYSKLIQAGDLTNQVNIEKVFVDIDVTETNQQDKRKKFLKQLIKYGDNKSLSTYPTKIVLVGGAGSGKSTLSQFASQIYSSFFISANRKEETDNVKNFISEYNISGQPSCLRFPFKIILKDFATWIKEQDEERKSKSVISYVKYRIETIGDGVIDILTIREFLRNISSLFIFDGLDEVPITSNRSDVLHEINTFIEIELKNLNSDSVILCTTRQQGYTKDFDNKTFKHYYISEFSNNDCITYLDKLLKNIETSIDDRRNYLTILKDALKDNVSGRLMRTPLQATIMAILVKSGGKPSRNKYNLFKEYYDIIYKRELQKELLPILKEHRRNIDDIHALLGFELQTKSEGSENPSALFDSDEFQKLINTYLKENEEWEDDDIDEFITKINHAVIERLVFIGEIQDNKIGFVIRSLQEYFAAIFLINFKDDIVCNNIIEISNSSYWRNTLLFAVSGLHNIKNHLVDQIYLHCDRLNGCEEEPRKLTPHSTISYGSWLSLDLLAEGIFSDSPKNRNRFSRLLEKLFMIIKTGDLSRIEYLPNKIINDLIINKYIKNNLYSDKSYLEKYSSYKLAFLMLKNSHFEIRISNILDKSWKQEFEFDLIKLMYDMKLSQTKFFLDKFSKAILKDSYFLYSTIFRMDFFNDFIMIKEIISQFKNEEKVIRRFIEISFLISLNTSNRSKDFDILAAYNEICGKEILKTQKNHIYNVLEYDIHEQEVTIVEGYSVRFGSINSNAVNLDSFYKMFNKYQLKYLCSYIFFMKNPTTSNLCVFLTDVKSINNNDIFNQIINSTDIWLFARIKSLCNNISEIDSFIQLINSNHFGNIVDWQEFEEKMLKKKELEYLLKYSPSRTWHNKIDILSNYYNDFKNDFHKNNINIEMEFIKIFNWFWNDEFSFGNEKKKEKEPISDILLDEILSIINSIDVLSLDNFQLQNLKYSIITYISNVTEKNIERINPDLFKLFDLNTYNVPIRPSRISYLSVLEKCIAYNNCCITLSKETNLEQLILYLCFNMDYYDFAHIERINFKTQVYSKGETIYKIILRLITSQMDIEDVDHVIKRINESSDSIIIYNIISKIFLNLKIDNTLFSNFIVKVYDKSIYTNNIEIIALNNFEKYLKFIIESKMTNIHQIAT